MSDTNPILTSVESLQIENVAGAIINPSTSENQTTEINLVDAVYELVSRLEFLPWIKWTLADIRVNTTWWSLSSVTTVSTVTNQAQMGWFLANTQVPSAMNTNAYLNNINNIVIS